MEYKRTIDFWTATLLLLLATTSFVFSLQINGPTLGSIVEYSLLISRGVLGLLAFITVITAQRERPWFMQLVQYLLAFAALSVFSLCIQTLNSVTTLHLVVAAVSAVYAVMLLLVKGITQTDWKELSALFLGSLPTIWLFYGAILIGQT